MPNIFTKRQKLLASDFDGTLQFDYVTPVASRDIQAIQLWQSQGNLFGIASGRSLGQIFFDLHQETVKQDFVIAHNGAMVFNENGEIIFEKYVDVTILAKIRELVTVHNLQLVIFYSNDDSELVYVNKRHQKEEGFHSYHNIKPQELTKVHKIVIEAKQIKAIEAFERDLFKRFNGLIESHRNVGAYTEITAQNVDKSIALKAVINYYNVDKNNVYTFGDSHNDYLMIKNYNGYTLPHGGKSIKAISLGVKANIKQLIDSLL